jgi:hypothetical protein
MKPCSNNELMNWMIGTMAVVVVTGVELYYLSGLPCGIGLFIAVALISSALAMVLAGIKPALNRYRDCWEVPDERCPVTFPIIDGLINILAGVIGITIVPLVVGASAAALECLFPIIGFGLSIVTARAIGVIYAALIMSSLALFVGLIWAIAEIHKCLSSI